MFKQHQVKPKGTAHLICEFAREWAHMKPPTSLSAHLAESADEMHIPAALRVKFLYRDMA